MPLKDEKARKLYMKKYRQENKERFAQHYRDKAKKRRKELRTWFNKYKATLKCSKCSENHPACLDFHHKVSGTKSEPISKLVTRGYGKKRLLIEIEKCEILCANCHRKKHHKNIKHIKEKFN